MINEITNYTRIKKNSTNLFDFNTDLSFLNELNYQEHIYDRQSSRHFKSSAINVERKDLIKLFTFLNEFIVKTFKFPSILRLAVVDNKKIISNNKKIYTYSDKQFHEIKTDGDIKKSNLYLQQEMHDSDATIFFLWDTEKLLDEKSPEFSSSNYKNMIMYSGILGQLSSEYGEKNSWIGTVFAGIIVADWEKIVVDKQFANYQPIFAYSFQSRK